MNWFDILKLILELGEEVVPVVVHGKSGQIAGVVLTDAAGAAEGLAQLKATKTTTTVATASPLSAGATK